ncbi:CIS tube protein [Parapedobacter sp. DT-150]|uniref:CIS tube protein n=1 Tax=Parapedobacter sp. DT-150 TaxID=3396162 RepID=UPI003F196692
MLGALSGSEKLYIEAYEDSEYRERSSGEKYTALINPASYSWSYKIKYTDEQAPGSIGARKDFVCIEPKQISFDLIFDGTGVVRKESVFDVALGVAAQKPQPVDEQLTNFREKFTYNGAKHQPYYLKIHWGTLIFQGVLREIDIQYKLFDDKGKPIRAVAKCTFAESLDEALQEAQRNNQSPDITHERLFGATDRIDRVANKIYGQGQYYTDVAAFNGLDGFRKINAGTKVYFPPLTK